jgi:hypothetical protein
MNPASGPLVARQVNSGPPYNQPDEYSSWIRFPVADWSLSFQSKSNGANALGRNRIYDKYSPGFKWATLKPHIWAQVGQMLMSQFELVFFSYSLLLSSLDLNDTTIYEH